MRRPVSPNAFKTSYVPEAKEELGLKNKRKAAINRVNLKKEARQ